MKEERYDAEKKDAWIKAMKEAGHDPVVADDGDLDIFVLCVGHCNGPGCSKCGWSTCWHCHPTPDALPKCWGTDPIVTGNN